MARAALWLLLCIAAVRSLTLPVLDWDALFGSLSVEVDDIYNGEFACMGNQSGHKSFLVFSAELSNPSTDSEIRLLSLPWFNVSLYNSSSLLAENSFQLAYLRDEHCPSIAPGFDHVFYNGLSPLCNVTVRKGQGCRWLDISELVNKTEPMELLVTYNGEQRNFTFELPLLPSRYRDAEFDWLLLWILVGSALVVVVLP